MPTVIDLLSSSPELPEFRATKKTDVSAPKAPALPSKVLTYDAPKRRNEGWLSISSDSVDVDDFLRPTPKLAPKPSTELKATSNTTSKAPQSTNKSAASESIFFNSDDFDSPVVLDDEDPFASDPPPAKKQRLAPPPNPSMISRSPHYQRWISKLEMSASSVSVAGPSDQSIAYAPSDVASSKPTPPKTNSGSSKNSAQRASSYKRSASDIGASSKSVAPRPSPTGMKRSKTMGGILESDPILFTSSPDPVADARKRKQKQTKAKIHPILVDSSDDDIYDLTPRKDTTGKTKSSGSVLGNSHRDSTLQEFELGSSDLDLPDLSAISSQRNPKTTKGKTSGKGAAVAALDKYEADKAKERKRKEKEQKAKDKLAAKEAEKTQKQIAKEEKAREKDRAAELAKVNILRTDKKKSTPEMIVDLPSTLDKRLTEQIQTFLQPVEAQHAVYESTQPIIKWRRKIDSEFDDEADRWEKVGAYIGREKHIMCIMKAQEFVELATGEEGKDLDNHVLRLKAKFATNEIIYLIEGLELWVRKNKTLQNRKYQNEVRNQNPEEAPAPTASQKRKRKPEMEHVDEDLVEDVLLKLQVIHGVLIHHTKVQIETAEWVIIFTQHISTVRYRQVIPIKLNFTTVDILWQSPKTSPRHQLLYGIGPGEGRGWSSGYLHKNAARNGANHARCRIRYCSRLSHCPEVDPGAQD